MSHLKNFALSASRGSMAVFIFGVVAALVGAMMLFAPAGYAQEETEAEVSEADVADASLDQEEPAQASEAEEEPVLYQDPISVERDDDIDTVTIDDREFGAWHDSFSDEEKVSDDSLYGISRKSDAGIDEIVEVEADGDVVDEDDYGFVHDDEADLDKIVIDYYGLKTTPPETLTLKVKSSEEGEYSILDADDIPAKADVQDAGFLPDPSAEEQEKIDKVKKENRAATENQTKELATNGEIKNATSRRGKDELLVRTGTGIQTSLKSGEVVSKDIHINRILLHDPEGQLRRGIGKEVYVQKNDNEFCKVSASNVYGVEKNPEYIAIDIHDCRDQQPKVREGSKNDTVMVYFPYIGPLDYSKLEMKLYGSPIARESAGEVDVPLPEGARQTDGAFVLEKEGSIEASENVESRDNPFKDSIKIDGRSEFKGATVNVKASKNILAPWKSSSYKFYIADQSGETGLQKGYGFGLKLIAPSDEDLVSDEVTYEVYPVDSQGKKVDKAIIENGTEIIVEEGFASLFDGNPETVTTTVTLKGDQLPSTDPQWTHKLGTVKWLPGGYIPSGNTLYDDSKYGFDSASGPFMLQQDLSTTGGREVLSFGGFCLEPYNGYPSYNIEAKSGNYKQYPTSYSPTGKTISFEKQKALSYIVNYLYDPKKTSTQARKFIAEKSVELLKDSPVNPKNDKEAFAIVIAAVLNLVGWDADSLENKMTEVNKAYPQSSQAKARRVSMARGEEFAAWLLAHPEKYPDEVNYQIFYPQNLKQELPGYGPWQTVIVPGDGGSAMSTAASLEKDNFDSLRSQKATLDKVDKAYDRVEYQGLKDGKYSVETELHRVTAEGTERVFPKREGEKAITDLNISGNGNGYVDVEVDLKNDVDSTKLQAGRYVFFEKIVRGESVELAHTSVNDKAQSFWIEDAPDENPSDASLELKKVSFDDENKAISGAEFTVSDSDDPNAPNAEVMTELKDVASDSPNYRIDGLKTGKDYWLFETKAPKAPEGADARNYQLLPEPIKFRLTKDGTPQFWDKNESAYSETGKIVFPVVNAEKSDNEGVVGVMTVANVWIGDLPKTGGNGIAPWLLLGGLIMAAGALMGNRRRA